MERVENIEITEEMKQQEAELLGEETEGQQEEAGQQETEMKQELAEAQRTGVVDMSDKKAEKEKKNPNYTHTFKTQVTI